MNYAQKLNLEKALVSQTWNQNLAGAVINAIEQDQKKAKPKQGPSLLQLAIEREKGKKFKSGPDTSEIAEE
ncbi:hypothetical protein [Prochlorococcus sp. MIT 1307]|uniref:hypothetical protein n=1 Tax=Prochlorococcus sp. MIT 1307 TaxID=3096219 RepID=UPI002A75A6B0|nr:hypothetical protein [Prochlorococcus sp. MIT 1307]